MIVGNSVKMIYGHNIPIKYTVYFSSKRILFCSYGRSSVYRKSSYLKVSRYLTHDY